MSKSKIISEIIEYLKSNKQSWLIPLVIIFIIIGVLMVIAQGSAIAPFIYTLF